MKIRQAIEKVDTLKPNHYEDRDKIQWLDALDRKVKYEVLDTHIGETTFTGYNSTTSVETELLIPNDFALAYIYWLEAQIDLNNNEIAKYNNNIALFNTEYMGYKKWYNQTHAHKPIGDFNLF